MRYKAAELVRGIKRLSVPLVLKASVVVATSAISTEAVRIGKKVCCVVPGIRSSMKEMRKAARKKQPDPIKVFVSFRM